MALNPSAKYDVTVETPLGEIAMFTAVGAAVGFRVALLARRLKWPRKALTVVARRLAP